MKSVMVTALDSKREAEARAFAAKAGLVYTQVTSCSVGYLVVFEENRIGITPSESAHAKTFYLDFASSRLQYRLKTASKQNELLAKAIGLKKGRSTPSVVDATAGLGQDACILATLGATVRLLERSPVLALLLHDALSRLEPITVRERMTLIEADSINWLQMSAKDSTFAADVIYLDPMFPHRTKSAAVKKEMRMLRELVGEDLDANRLFAAALACPVSRIVVKRPARAPFLIAEVEPTFSVKGRANRFDVYIR